MTGDVLELLIIAFIVGTMSWLIWKGGAANPESTGVLGKRVASLSGRLGEVELDIDQLKKTAASKDDVARLADQLVRLQASTTELGHELKLHRQAAEGRMQALAEMGGRIDSNREATLLLVRRQDDVEKINDQLLQGLASVSATTLALEKSVDRIYNVITQKGMA